MKKYYKHILVVLSISLSAILWGASYGATPVAAATPGTCYFEASATTNNQANFASCTGATIPGTTLDPQKCYVITASSGKAAATEAACATLGVSSGGSTATSTGIRCEDGSDLGDCAKTTSFAFAGCGTDNVGIRCLAVEILKFLSVGVGLAVVGGVAAGGIVYATAQGSPGKTQTGIKIITNSVIALVLYLLMFAILQFLIPGGILK